MDQHSSVLVETVKLAPAVAVSGFTLFGYPLSAWAQLVTIIYTIILLAFLIYDRFIKKKPINKERKEHEEHEECKECEEFKEANDKK